MRVLIVKMSSLGDVIHALAAVTDARRALPDVQFDWVVEEAYKDMPAWHPAVDRVIPIALRRWRKAPLKALRSGEWRRFRQQLREREYDLVLDAQGLIKSAWVARKARGPRYGFDRDSIREPIAARAYQHRIAVAKGRHTGQHAVERLRKLFALTLNYPLPQGPAEFGVDRRQFLAEGQLPQGLIFFHGTVRDTKCWPEPYWRELAERFSAQGYAISLPWGNEVERARAERIADELKHVSVMPRMGIDALVLKIAAAKGVVGVDTGLTYLALALGVPTVAIYGSTDPVIAKAGPGQAFLQAQFACAPCFAGRCNYTGESPVQPACYQSIPPQRVEKTLLGLLAKTGAEA